jgi:hypothetical protein
MARARRTLEIDDGELEVCMCICLCLCMYVFVNLMCVCVCVCVSLYVCVCTYVGHERWRARVKHSKSILVCLMCVRVYVSMCI